MSEPEDFDFEAECIKVYRGAKDDDVRIKALALIAKLQPPRRPVKEETDADAAVAAARRAQDKMNGGKK